ncbi:hypothetical protein [Listeria booriae]|uniref:hypothetical protein n=1 Tax=Listeria booriae TaxID=1552123 RepID=UPI0016279F08|nr:hypothetical protein [Listeria booriae]MBC2196282.1 hypothetical protein [Listeria booriae]
MFELMGYFDLSELINKLGTCEENEKMKKLEISNELHEKITREIEKIDTFGMDDLYKLYEVTGILSSGDLTKNGLTEKDVYDLAMGNYTVKPIFEVGKYYYSLTAIFKVIGLECNGVVAMFLYNEKGSVVVNTFQYGSPRDTESRPAKKSEVKLFNRAEQFHKQMRELNEFKHGDVVRRAQGEPFYFREIHEGEESTLTLICTKEKRGDL